MEKIEFGVGISMPIQPGHRDRAETFFAEVLGCKQVMKNSLYTCFQFPNGQVIGITPDTKALSEQNYEKSTWLEIVSGDFEATKKRAQTFGVREVSGGSEDAFFFNIPGGAVLRLISEETARSMRST